MDVLTQIFDLCKVICQMADDVKANKDRCQRVAQRVRTLERLVKAIDEKGPGQISSTVQQALDELCDTLKSAKQLMTKFQKSSAIKGFVKTSSNEDKFSKINEKLDDNFQILSGSLQIEQRDMLILLCSSKRSVDEGDGPAQTSPLPFPMPEPWHATSVFSNVAQPHPTVPMSPQSPPFSPTAPYPPQAPPIRPPAPLPPQTQQFRPPAPLPPQTQQFRPPAPLPPQTQQFRPPASFPPQTQQFRPPAPFPPQTQQFRPPAPFPPQTPMSGPISTVPHCFPASVPAHLLNPGNAAPTSGPAVLNITMQNTNVMTHYPANNIGFR